MSIELICSSCRKVGNVPDAYAGLTVKCPDCQATIAVPVLPADGFAASTPAAGGPTPDWMADAPAVPSPPAASTPVAVGPTVSDLPDAAQAHLIASVEQALPGEPWYYPTGRVLACILALLVLLHAGVMAWRGVAILLNAQEAYDAARQHTPKKGDNELLEAIERMNTMKAASEATGAALLTIGASVIEGMAIVVGLCLALVVVDAASKMRRVAHYAGRRTG